MPEICLDNNLHTNSGTSQQQRALSALAAQYVLVDERSTADLLIFAKKYGSYLNYFDDSNVPAGDWSVFMSKDISVIISSIQEWNARDYISYIKNLYSNIQSATTNADAQTNFKYIFDLIFSLSKNLNDTLIELSAKDAYAAFLSASISSKLAIPSTQLKVYYISFLGTVLSGASLPATDPFSPFNSTVSVSLNASDFQNMFGFIDAAPWIMSNNVIVPPATLFTGDSITGIINNNFFTGAVTAYLNGIASIINQTGAYLNKTILNYPEHSPHYALYLSFLRLFKFAQDHLNKYTNRHLKFYYKKTLKLKNNNGLPDTAHLVFTLQKNIDQHLLKKGTQFKAGKNVNGNDIFYVLTNDVVANQATIQMLKSLYLVKNFNNRTSIIPQQLFASPVANSSNGQGGKITNTDNSWYAFGDLTNPDFVSNSIANIGFAIASNILFLNEGTRTIKITINTQRLTKDADLTGIFSVKFTGNKKWFDASDYSSGSDNNIDVKTKAATNQLIIIITLNGNAPPIIPYSQKIHGGNFTQALPMIQILVSNYEYYSAIKSLLISLITIEVHVDEVKNISLQNDAGKIDTSKPFKPFGEFPDTGSSLIIANKEIFQKPLNSLIINFSGLTFPDTTDSNTKSINVTANILSIAKWNDLDFLDSSGNIVGSATMAAAGESLNIQLSNLQQPVIPDPDFTPDFPYTASSTSGFIKLIVNQPDFNLYNYLKNVQVAAAKNTVTLTGDPPTTYQLNAPATPPPAQPSPVVNALYLSYDARTTFLSQSIDEKKDFNNRQNFFYHIEPFGFREMHPFLFSIPPETDTSLIENQLTILPVFNLDNGSQSNADKGQSADPDNGGELWIGITGSQQGETQSVLFEVFEGSSNPLKNNATVNWFYLSNNNWIAFDPQTNINDQTNNLSESGLIVFNMPYDTTTNNTRADNNLLWLRASVNNNTDAVSKLISVQTNAAKAQFVVNAAQNIYFTENIPANTISKPAVADAALKQTSQPYASFGGSPKETNKQFNQRISERLRHKHRAVTAWDYERLILQNFPQIHKVKCLNHTDLKSKTQSYNEMKPGDVMIVTIPDLSLVSGASPLLPFTNVRLLTDIKKFIKPLCSSFVHVHVCNPQFETVQFDFNVYFKNNNSNSSYYITQLNTDIQHFMMPWAFGSNKKDIEFGGKIEKSVVLKFVQDRPYVDFVTCFKMFKYIFRIDGTYSAPTADADEATASTARSILVPHFKNNIYPTANCKCNGQ